VKCYEFSKELTASIFRLTFFRVYSEVVEGKKIRNVYGKFGGKLVNQEKVGVSYTRVNPKYSGLKL
jgi:hypothetical protein